MRDLTKVDARPAYRAEMHRLDQEGLANAKTIKVLSTLLADLRAAAASALGSKLPRARVAVQGIPHLHQRHVHKAMRRASLHVIGDDFPLTYTIGAALAAAGIGLCKHYRDLPPCDYEQTQMPDIAPLGIDYSNESLSTTFDGASNAPGGYEFSREASWSLGRNRMPDSNDADEPYWHDLRDAVQWLPRRARCLRVTDIFLMGDAASDARFQAALRDALREILPAQPPLTLSSAHVNLRWTAHSGETPLDPLFLVARGAAILGKRRMEQPDGCVEPFYCRWWHGLGGDARSMELYRWNARIDINFVALESLRVAHRFVPFLSSALLAWPGKHLLMERFIYTYGSGMTVTS